MGRHAAEADAHPPAGGRAQGDRAPGRRRLPVEPRPAGARDGEGAPRGLPSSERVRRRRHLHVVPEAVQDAQEHHDLRQARAATPSSRAFRPRRSSALPVHGGDRALALHTRGASSTTSTPSRAKIETACEELSRRRRRSVERPVASGRAPRRADESRSATMVKEYRTVQEIAGPLLLVGGVSGVKYEELVEVELPDGERAAGQSARGQRGHRARAALRGRHRRVGRQREGALPRARARARALARHARPRLRRAGPAEGRRPADHPRDEA